MKKRSFLIVASLMALCYSVSAQVPVLSPINGQLALCWNASVPLNTYSVTASNSPSFYSWFIVPSAGVTLLPGGSSAMINFPNSNVTYTLYCSATNGSGNSVPVVCVINVFHKPTVTFSGKTMFCQGSSTNLSASGTLVQGSSTQGSSTLFYTWSPPAGLSTTVGQFVTAFPPATTTYSVTVYNGLCSTTAPITVVVNPNPTVTVNSANPMICEGESVELKAFGANSYQWNTGGVLDTILVSPPVTTNYTVTGTDFNGCSADFVISQGVDVCTGIRAHSGGLESCSVYPNPSSGLFQVDPGTTNDVPVQLEVMNALGQVVVTDLISSPKVVDLTNLPNGIYLAVLRQRSAVKTIKLIKE